MCQACYYQDYGSPLPDATAYALVEYMDRFDEDDLSFGALHLVIEDFNIEDDHIKSCLSEAKPHEIEIANRMLSMTLQQRAAALAVHWGVVE